MANDKVLEVARQNGLLADPLTQLIREGARELVHGAVQLEFQSLLSLYEDDVDEAGRARVVRNGYHPERKIQTGIGPVCVKVPKVRTRSGAPVTFHSALVPPYVRKAKSLEAALPWLYLKGVSSGEMDEALKVLVGRDAEGLSASTVSRLKKEWKGQYEQWRQSRLDQDEWVYIWVDGIYSGLRAEDVKLCTLVMIGVNGLGKKKFLAIEDGVRESTQSWLEVLVKLKKRGLNAPGWQSEMVPWGSGPPLTKSSAKRATNVAGCTRQIISWGTCPNLCRTRQGLASRISGWHRPMQRQKWLLTCLWNNSRASIPEQWNVFS